MMRPAFLVSTTESNDMTNTVSIAGTTLELVDRGLGRPLLFLHAGEGLAPERPWLELLSRRYRVIAPWHPGYSNSPLIDGGGSVDDLAYLYLDLAVQLGLDDAVLVGACFGGWVAAEMMVRSTARFSHLVLVDPLGIKIGGREERDIADMHGLPRAEYLELAWADPESRTFPALGTARGICPAFFGLCRQEQLEEEIHARLVLLGDGLPPRVGAGDGAWLPQGCFAEHQLRPQGRSRPAQSLS